MPIHAVGDVISEAVVHHPFPVCFPDAIALTQPTEGVPAGMRRSLWETQLSQCALHIPSELRDALAIEERPLHAL